MKLARKSLYLHSIINYSSKIMANIFTYSIGKKFIQSVSGAFLIIFLTIHTVINSFSLIDTFKGTFGTVAVDNDLFSKGDGLYKLGCDFMSTPFISIIVPVLAFGLLIHFIYGAILTFQNIKARGGYKRYAVKSKAAVDSWSAKNMFALGVVIVGFLCFHLCHFWAKMQLPEMFGIGTYEDNPYCLLIATFGKWWVTLLYIVWLVALWFHLMHGFWSMFQTVGWSGDTWYKRLKCIGSIVVSLLVLVLILVAVNSFLHANGVLPNNFLQ